MSDDLAKRGPADAKRISLSEDWEVRYWTKALGCTEDELREAVEKAGHMAASVRAWLAARDPATGGESV